VRARIVSGDPEWEALFPSATVDLESIFANKEKHRELLRHLSAPEKFRKLEEMLKAGQLQDGTRRAPPPKNIPEPPRLGGRSTAQGVGYEVRIAAWFGVKMLAGDAAQLWGAVSGADILSVTPQAPTSVDDVVLELTEDRKIFLSAKMRSQKIALTPGDKTFRESIEAFVKQYLHLETGQRSRSQLVWAIPLSVGNDATKRLADILQALRQCDAQISHAQFVETRTPRERGVFEKLRVAVFRSWREVQGEEPTPEAFLDFVRCIWVELFEFDGGLRSEREAVQDLAQTIVANPKDAPHAWSRLQHFFHTANERGIPVTRSVLRRELGRAKVALKTQPDFQKDVETLKKLTVRNRDRLCDHTMLPFKSGPFHIPRPEELSHLRVAVESGDTLVTGEPGSGKTGLLDSLPAELNVPVVLLLAEELAGSDWKGSANLPALEHSLDEVLAQWPGSQPGVLITDALDAVRDPDTQKKVRDLLRDVMQGESGWTVVASVREFDLQYGRELREMFPGSGAAGFASEKFPDVAHFHVPRLSDSQLAAVASGHPGLEPFIQAAFRKEVEVHRSPFYLRLAVELLNSGTPPHLLADWTSPAMLLRKFWEHRVTRAAKPQEVAGALGMICREMVRQRTTAISMAGVSIGIPERQGIDELRHNGVLQAPAGAHGTLVGEDVLCFTHHLLHDYAISAVLIPKVPDRFVDLVTEDLTFPVFYRPSFLFALEELWDLDVSRQRFWHCSLALEEKAGLYGFTRILGPLVAAKRAQCLADLEPVLQAVGASNPSAANAGHKALLHLISGLQDADSAAVRSGAIGWLGFAEGLSRPIGTHPSVEWPLAQLVERLRTLDAEHKLPERHRLGTAGRAILNYHVQQPVSPGRRFPAKVAIEAICQTFAEAVPENKESLGSLLTDERIEKWPHNDLFDLAHSLRHLGTAGDDLILRLFEVAFGRQPEPDEWEESGSAIMSMRFQTRDSWNAIRHALAAYYQQRKGENPGLMVDAVCIAWTEVVGQRRATSDFVPLGTTPFRGRTVQLVEDYSHIWGRSHEADANRILSHFEQLLRTWADNDQAKLGAALDHFAARQAPSLLWQVILETGAEFPHSLGQQLRSLLETPLFLCHPDYVHGGARLLAALHRIGDAAERERLEELILTLPDKMRIRDDATPEQRRRWTDHAQDRLLTLLEASNITTIALRQLMAEREAATALPAPPPQQGIRVTSRNISEEEIAAGKGIDLKDTQNQEMFQLKQALGRLARGGNQGVSPEEIERHWSKILQANQMVEQYRSSRPEMAQDLWGYLVGACAHIPADCSWESTDARWEILRDILLRASNDLDPTEDDTADREDGYISWGWPAPRIDAAEGLPALVNKRGETDLEISAALRKMRGDSSVSVRYNLAVRLGKLYAAAPDLMWELLEAVVHEERRLAVLEGTIDLLLRLRLRVPDEPRATSLLDAITHDAREKAPPRHHIHETLAMAHLFHFLQTGDERDKRVIDELIADCDSPRAQGALLPLLHNCRSGGWLTVGDALAPDAKADGIRARTWTFFAELLDSAQKKLRAARATLISASSEARPDGEQAELVRGRIGRAGQLVDGLAMQLYFASGAYRDVNEKQLSSAEVHRFWQEAAPLFKQLATELHPHTAYQIIQTLGYLLPCAPKEIFLLAAESIRSSSQAGFQHESLAVGEVVKLVQRVLADYRYLLKSRDAGDSKCLQALLDVLDLFVEAGWAEARQLTHRLEEIYR